MGFNRQKMAAAASPSTGRKHKSLTKPIDPRIATPLAMLMLVLGLLILYFYFSALGKLVPPHADSSYLILYAQAVLEGNITLRDWNLSSVGFYTELPFYVAAVKLTGVNPDLIRLVPAAIHTINVGLCLFIVWKYRIAAGWLKYMPIIAFLVLPASAVWAYTLTSAIHMVTLSAGLVLILLLNDDLILVRKSHMFLVFAIAVVATWSDLAFVFYFVAPLAVAGAWRWWGQSIKLIGFSISTLAPAVAGSIMGHATMLLCRAAGMGSPVGIFETAFDVPDRALTKASHLTHAWWQFFGGDFWGRAFGLESVAIFVLGLSLLWWIVAVIEAVRLRDSGIDLFFMLMLPVMVAAILLTTKEGMAGSRYIVPAFFGAVFLMSRYAQRPSTHDARRNFAALIAVAAVIASGFFLPRYRLIMGGDAYASDFRRAAKEIKARGFTSGFGDYWATHPTMVALGPGYKIIPLQFSDENEPMFFALVSNKRWFDTAKGRFAVFHGGLADNLEDHFFINLAPKRLARGKAPDRTEQQSYVRSAVAAWGKPAEVLEFGNVLLLIWRHEIDITGSRVAPGFPVEGMRSRTEFDGSIEPAIGRQ